MVQYYGGLKEFGHGLGLYGPDSDLTFDEDNSFNYPNSLLGPYPSQIGIGQQILGGSNPFMGGTPPATSSFRAAPSFSSYLGAPLDANTRALIDFDMEQNRQTMGLDPAPYGASPVLQGLSTYSPAFASETPPASVDTFTSMPSPLTQDSYIPGGGIPPSVTQGIGDRQAAALKEDIDRKADAYTQSFSQPWGPDWVAPSSTPEPAQQVLGYNRSELGIPGLVDPNWGGGKYMGSSVTSRVGPQSWGSLLGESALWAAGAIPGRLASLKGLVGKMGKDQYGAAVKAAKAKGKSVGAEQVAIGHSKATRMSGTARAANVLGATNPEAFVGSVFSKEAVDAILGRVASKHGFKSAKDLSTEVAQILGSTTRHGKSNPSYIGSMSPRAYTEQSTKTAAVMGKTLSGLYGRALRGAKTADEAILASIRSEANKALPGFAQPGFNAALSGILLGGLEVSKAGGYLGAHHLGSDVSNTVALADAIMGATQDQISATAVDEFSDFQTNPGRYAELTSAPAEASPVGSSIGQYGVDEFGNMVKSSVELAPSAFNYYQETPSGQPIASTAMDPFGSFNVGATEMATGVDSFGGFGYGGSGVSPGVEAGLSEGPSYADERAELAEAQQAVANALADPGINVAATIAEQVAQTEATVNAMGLTGAAAAAAAAQINANQGYVTADEYAGFKEAQQAQDAAEAAAAAAQAADAAAAAEVDDFSGVDWGQPAAPAASIAEDRAVQNAIIDALVSAVGPEESALSAGYMADLGYGGGFAAGKTGAEGLNGDGMGGFGSGWT